MQINDYITMSTAIVALVALIVSILSYRRPSTNL